MALLDSWRQERMQRQQQVRERSSQVRSNLASLQKERQVKALQMQSELGQFRDNLARSTGEFLAGEGDRRRAGAQLLAKELDEFARSLAISTADFLTLTTVTRAIASFELTKDLHDFHEALSATVAALRQSIQDRQASDRAELNKKLADFVMELRDDVQSYLQELQILRSLRSQKLEQSFRQNRTERLQVMQALFDRLARFQAELQQYHINLQLEVWGSSVAQQATQQAPELSKASASDSVASSPAATVPKTVTYEQKVYDYIRQTKGARLMEIETALAINRIQTVDALRALMEKGLIADRDRTYIIQEAINQNITIAKIEKIKST